MRTTPPKMRLIKVDESAEVAGPEDRVLEVQFNPTQLEVGVKAIWNAQAIPGASHELLQFSHTSSMTVNVELYMRVTDQQTRGTREQLFDFAAERSLGIPGLADANQRARANANGQLHFTLEMRQRAERFLLSLVYPRGGQTNITRAAPPTVAVVWPGFLTFDAVVESLDFRYTRFNTTGQPVEVTVPVVFKELRDIRFTSFDALHQGFFRNADGDES
jgi:hypothetical protein